MHDDDDDDDDDDEEDDDNHSTAALRARFLAAHTRIHTLKHACTKY